MSDTKNHKKAIAITRMSRKKKGMLLDIYLQILADQPSAIVNAAEALKAESLAVIDGQRLPDSPVDGVYICKDCLMAVARLGIAGACIKCDPRGFDVPY